MWLAIVCFILTIGIQIGIRHERNKVTEQIDKIMNTGLTP